MKKILKISSWIFLGVILTGCFMFKHDDDSKRQEFQRGNVAKLVDQLSKYKIRVLRRGQSVVLVLPNKKFFISNSANFTSNAYGALDLILGFSSFYKGTSIAVNGCAENARNAFARALVSERARKIVQHLWKSKIYANFIYVDDANDVFYDNKVLSDCILIEFVDFYFL